METIGQLFKSTIYWQKHSQNNRYYYAYRNDQLLLLRLNDFPDEPYCTLIRSNEIIDIDDIPPEWVIEYGQ
jgi:hypothetical protein